MIPPYPLHWPDGLPRTERRESSRMRTSLAAALDNVRDSLRRFGDDTGKPVANAAHPDAGGTQEQMARLNRARDEGRKANG